jgi:hypothetical protein
MSHFDEQMANIQQQMDPAMNELLGNLAKPSITELCPEHYTNMIIYGKCWRHNADGSLKSTFTKKV